MPDKWTVASFWFLALWFLGILAETGYNLDGWRGVAIIPTPFVAIGVLVWRAYVADRERL